MSTDYKRLKKQYRLSKGVIMHLEMNSPGQIMKEKGLSPNGDVQQFHTANVLRRIIKYMPYRTGMTIKATIVQTDIRKPRIVTDTPFAKYLYYGKAMKGRAPMVATDKDLRYTKEKNRKAGPFWDRELVSAEGDALRADLQRYVDRKAGKR